MQYFRVADILVQPRLIDAYNIRLFGVHQVLEAKEVTHGLPVCCAVFVKLVKLLAFITRQLILPAVETETGPGLSNKRGTFSLNGTVMSVDLIALNSSSSDDLIPLTMSTIHRKSKRFRENGNENCKNEIR